MKENLKLGGILLTITVIAGLLLGFANSLTAEAILENSKVSKEDLKVILPYCILSQSPLLIELSTIFNFFLSLDSVILYSFEDILSNNLVFFPNLLDSGEEVFSDFNHFAKVLGAKEFKSLFNVSFISFIVSFSSLVSNKEYKSSHLP